jgi:hypothetical protein
VSEYFLVVLKIERKTASTGVRLEFLLAVLGVPIVLSAPARFAHEDVLLS